MKSLKDSKILLASFNNNLDSLASLLLKIDPEKDAIPDNEVEELLRLIHKRENYVIKNKVLSDFSDEKVVLVYGQNSDTFGKLPSFIPIWSRYVIGNKVKTFVNLTGPAMRRPGKDLNIGVRTLFALMTCGSIMQAFVTTPDKFLKNVNIYKNLNIIYTKMITKAIDKNFGISQNRVDVDKLSYFISKFFFLNLLEMQDNISVKNMAAETSQSTSKDLLLSIDSEFDEKNYHDINDFLDGLGKYFPRLSNLVLRSLMLEIAKTYKPFMLLSIEFMPYLLMNVVSTVLSAGLNNDFAFENICGKEGLKIFQEINKIM